MGPLNRYSDTRLLRSSANDHGGLEVKPLRNIKIMFCIRHLYENKALLEDRLAQLIHFLLLFYFFFFMRPIFLAILKYLLICSSVISTQIFFSENFIFLCA